MPKAKNQEKNQNIQVVVRCRPINEKENRQGNHTVVELDQSRNEVSVRDRLAPVNAARTFAFDHVFGPQSKQIEVYKTIVVPIIEEVLLGYNCTVFAYGQTGTGKTYTMEGDRSLSGDVSWEDDPECGIIPRAMSHLFARLTKQSCEFSVRVSFLEIYNEELIDLLGAESVDNPKLKVYEDVMKKGSCVIQGLEEVVVQSKDQVYSILQTGTARRQTAATQLNAHSSRSHTLFMVTVHTKENSDDGEELVKTGKLNLVDLAGSECIGRSGAVDKRAREAGNINQSLLTLGRVITSLVEHAPHVPYRESKLTRLLQDSLGGRTKTSIIATFSPSSSCLEETISTLEYAQRAKSIMNRPEINQKLSKRTLIKEYTEEIERLRKDLQASRDKNGIFLAEENYNDMQSRLLQQKDQINEFEELIATKEAELLKLMQLFETTKLNLEQRTEDLRKTTVELVDTRGQLRETKGILKQTVKEREEQRYLVQEHVQTESVLHGQASQLLSVTTESIDDVHGLHAKIDRKKAVEQHNVLAQQQFWSVYTTANEMMRNKLLNYITEQADINNRLQGKLNILKQLELDADSSLRTSIATYEQRFVEQVENLVSQQEAMISHGYTTATNVNTILKSASRDADELCNRFVSATFTSAIKELQSLYEHILSQQRTICNLLIQQSESSKQQMMVLCDGLLDQIDSQSELVRSFTNQQKSQLLSQRQQLTEFLEVQQAYDTRKKMEMMTAVGSLLDELFAEKSTSLACNASQVFTFLDTGTANMNKHETNFNSLTDDLCDQVETGRQEMKALIDQHHVENETILSQIDQTVESLKNNTNKFEADAKEFITNEQQHWKSCVDKVESLSREAANEQETLSKQQTTKTEAIKEGCQDELSVLNTRISEHCVQITDLVCQHTNELMSQWAHTGEHAKASETALIDQLHRVQIFLHEDLHADLPTGKTPQRKEYQYPHNLTLTKPHDELIERFRLTYPEDETPDTSTTLSVNESAFKINSLENAVKEAVAADKLAINHEPNGGNIQFSSVSSVDEISDSCSYDGSSSEVSSKLGGSYLDHHVTTKHGSVHGSVEITDSKENMQPPTKLPTAKKVRDISAERTASRVNSRARQKLPLQLSNP